MKKHISLVYFVALLSLPALFHVQNLMHEKGVVTVFFYLLFYLLLLVLPLVFIRPVLFCYTVAPFLLLMPFELIHVTYYDGYTTLAAFVSTLETNPDEATEFQHNYRHFFYILYPLILLSLYALVKYIKFDYRLSVSLRLGLFVSLFVVVAAFTARISYDLYSRGEGSYVYVYKDLSSRLFQHNFPYSYFYKGYKYIKQREAVAQSLDAKKDFIFHSAVSAGEQQKAKPVIVLVIGETSRANNWRLNGYERNTNPYLSARSNLFYYTDTVSAATHTNQTIQLVLSRATPRNLKPMYSEKSLISAFKEAGFYTAWISNQNMTGGVDTPIYTISTEADERRFVGSDYRLNSKFDDVLMPLIEKVLNENQDNPLFMVVHTMGSHEVYRNRYPPDFEIFKPASQGDDYNFASPGIRERIVNSYDNSILYTDCVLDRIIETIVSSGRHAAMAYFSDHGENLLDDGGTRFGHGGVIPTPYVTDVPMFVWVSDEYRGSYSEKYSNLLSNKDKPVSSLYMFDTMLDLGGVKINGAENGFSLAGPHVFSEDRYILNTDYRPVSYDVIRVEAGKEKR